MSIITQDGKDQGIAKKSSESSSASISRGRHCQIIRLLLIFIFLLVISTTLFLVGYSSTSSFETILNKNCPPSSSSSSNLFDQGSDQDVDSAESAGGALVLATLTSTIEITVTTTVTITPSPSPPSYIIHQSWKTTNLPSSFKKWSDSWLFHNPGFKRIVWDDEDNRNLIALHYPWFLSTYDSLPKHIEKVDAARIFYLHKFGGVYSDMDVECLASVAPLLESNELVLGRMGPDEKFEHSIPNAVMMARRPGHDFWMWCARFIMQQDGHSIEGTAGPIMLFKVYLEYMKHQEQLLSSSYPSSNNHNHDIEKDTRDGSIFIAPPSALFPYSWEHDRKIWGDCSAMSGKQNTTRCIERMRDRLKDPIKDTMYTITYWSHSWGGGFQGGEKADGK